ncbi:MAG: hypothetical protein JWQ13_312 [Ramlibacter sp.]|jgi:hypothetical protein|nr:hypothetical protein [Ramlibacter sp.]
MLQEIIERLALMHAPELPTNLEGGVTVVDQGRVLA